MAASVIEGFLVNLGFSVDKDSQARFNAGLQEAEKKVRHLGLKAAAAATAMYAAWYKASSKLSTDFNIAHYANASISGLNSLRMAFKAVGADAGMADKVIGTMGERLRTIPGYADQIENLFGVAVRDANGNLRDTTDIVADISAAMQGMDDATAASMASAIGLGDSWQYMKNQNFPGELRKAKEQTAALGGALDSTAESSNELWKSLGNLWAVCKQALTYLAGFLNKTFDISGMVDRLAKWLGGDGIKNITANVAGGIQTVKNLFSGKIGLTDVVSDFKKNAQTALNDQEAMIANSAGKNNIAGGTPGKELERKGIPAAGEVSYIGTKAPKGVRNNNPGNIRKDKHSFQTYGTFAEGVEALGKQLKRYQNSGAQTVADLVRTWAPANENDTVSYIKRVSQYLSSRLGANVGAYTALDLRDPRQMQAMIEAITRQENGNGYQKLIMDPSLQDEIRRATQFTGRSRNFHEWDRSRVDNKLTVNQTIYVSDSNAARNIAQTTKAAIADGQRSMM